MTKPKRTPGSADQGLRLIGIRADRDWTDRVRAEAKRLGLTGSDYVRMAVTERLERTDREHGLS